MDLTPENFILRIPAILIALTVHEYAHGWVAFKLGDRTAYNAGRLTFNPFAHLDLFGSIMLLFGPFGWAKPVPVDPRYFQNPKKGIVMVSLAGPVSNIILALLFGYLLRFFVSSGEAPTSPYLIRFFSMVISINIGISFFNLLPIPPLDGSKILLGMLPDRAIPGYIEKTRHVPTIFMIMIVAEWALHIPIFSTILNPLYIPYNTAIKFLIFWNI